MNIEQAAERTILRVLAGSHIHGLSVPESDRDEEAIVLESIEEAIGLGHPFEELIRESAEVDVKYVSLRKWCRLALKGNPNFLLPLFAPSEFVLSGDARGFQLRELREAFISKHTVYAHLGYMKGQRHRMQTGSHGGRGEPRMDLIEKYGYDTKYGMHLIRLGVQGLELARSGVVTLPMPEPIRTYCREIRAGLWGLDAVLWLADTLVAQMEDAVKSSALPDVPDLTAVENKMVTLYERQWQVDRIERDRTEDKRIFGLSHAALD